MHQKKICTTEMALNNREEKENIFRIDYILISLLLGTMALIAFANVLGRYFFHYSISCTEELTINMFVWVTVLGTGVAFERGAHLGMVTFYNIFPKKLQKSILFLGAFLGVALYLIIDIILIYSIYKEITLYQTKSSLGVPNWIYYLGVVLLSPSIPVGIFRGLKKSIVTASENKEKGNKQC